jgi:hypothetical protein
VRQNSKQYSLASKKATNQFVWSLWDTKATHRSRHWPKIWKVEILMKSAEFLRRSASEVAVGIATGNGLDSRGIMARFPTEAEIFFFSTVPRPVSESGLFLWGTKQPGCTSSAEFKDERIYPSTPPYVLMAWCLINAQGRILHFLRILISSIWDSC